MEEFIEETFSEETEETIIVTSADEIEETTVVTTVPEEETTTVTETEQTTLADDVIESVTDEQLTVDVLSEEGHIYFESNDMKNLYELIQQDNQTTIALLQEQNAQLLETNTVLVNFFFCFMVLMVCKFVHFLFYKVFFGGLT